MSFWDGKERINLNDVNNSVIALEKKVDTIAEYLTALDQKIVYMGQMVETIYKPEETKKVKEPVKKDPVSEKIKELEDELALLKEEGE